MIRDGASTHKIDYIEKFKENINLKGHQNRNIGSNVTAILLKGGILHQEGSAPAACAVGLFVYSRDPDMVPLCV